MSTPEAADSEEAKAAAGTEAADEEGKEEELIVLGFFSSFLGWLLAQSGGRFAWVLVIFVLLFLNPILLFDLFLWCITFFSI
jgi:hypothetical protein